MATMAFVHNLARAAAAARCLCNLNVTLKGKIQNNSRANREKRGCGYNVA
jgi:hypothetical protein